MAASVTYGAVLDMHRETVLYLSGLLQAQRRTRKTRRGRRALSCFRQAVLVCRWFLDGTRIARLAADNAIGRSTCYRYLHEGIDVLGARAPELHTVLEQAISAGLAHLNLDGVVIPTDRSKVPGPTGHDLWWSGKHKHHGGNIQVLSTPDGWPLWTSDVRPGREHDITCARHHGVIDALSKVRAALPILADLGYEGAEDAVRVPVKKHANRSPLTDDQKTFNTLIRGVRGIGERANALLIMRFKALRRVSLCPRRIGAITSAALVLLHHENNRTL